MSVFGRLKKLEPLLKNVAGVSGSCWPAKQEGVQGRGIVSSPFGFWDGVGASASMPRTSWLGGSTGNFRELPRTFQDQSGLKGKATRARTGYRKCAVMFVKPEHMPERI